MDADCTTLAAVAQTHGEMQATHRTHIGWDYFNADIGRETGRFLHFAALTWGAIPAGIEFDAFAVLGPFEGQPVAQVVYFHRGCKLTNVATFIPAEHYAEFVGGLRRLTGL